MAPRRTGIASDLFQALVEDGSDAIAVVDGRGVVQFASRSTARLLGYPPEEQQGRRFVEIVHDADLFKVRNVLARSLEHGQPVTFEFLARHKDGSWRQLEAIAINRLADPAVGGVVICSRDVTERKRADDPLKASELRLRQLFETAPDTIWCLNPQGFITYANPSASRVTKYDGSELVGRQFFALVRPDSQTTVKEFYARQMTEQTVNSYLEFPIIAKDGETIWVGQHTQLLIDDGHVLGAQAICRDISKQKAAEIRLRRSEARYRSLIQGAAYGLFRTTLAGRILDANPAFANMLGYDSVEDLKTINITAVYASPETRALIIERHLRSPGRTLSGEFAWRKKDGTPMMVRLAARLVDFALDDDFTGNTLEGIAEDITHKRALEEQLRQSQKMEAVGRLARGIAHDFNNVLAAILGSADLMQLRLKSGDDLMVEAVEIGKAAERGAALTRQLLAFSRRQAVEPAVMDVHSVLRGFDSMMQRITGDITLRLDTPGSPPMVRLEPGQLEQVVMNLVLNARDASRRGGVIEVSGDIVTFNAPNIPGLPAGPYARIAVHDSGTGIDPELQRLVFEPFFTTKDPAKGNGLGLSIVYGIAREAGGTVTFTSQPGQGTTFEVFLPLVSQS
jgi:two-component system, cell cycle sensor histidine kinase and response regulator CckA